MDILLKLPILDIFLLIGLIIGLFTGLHNGVIRKSFRFGVFALLSVIAYFALVPFLANFVEYNLLATFNITLNIPIMGYTFVCYSIHDIALIMQNFNVDSALLASFVQNICKALTVFIVLTLVGILSVPITWILFDCVIARALSKKDENGKRIKYRPKVVSRIFGAVVGIIEWAFVEYIFSQCYGVLTSGFNELLIPSLNDSSSSLYYVITQTMGESNISMISSVLTIINNSLNPQCSYILKYLYPSNSGIWMFKGVVVSYNEANEATVKESSIQESFTQLYEEVIESLKEVLSSTGTEESIA